MKCPRCGSETIRRSQSQDSVWFRFVLQKMMRCHRCCYVFAANVWDRPASGPSSTAFQVPAAEVAQSDPELELVPLA